MSTTIADLLLKARALYEANPSHAAPGEMPEPGCECLVTACDGACTDEYGYGFFDLQRPLCAATGTNELVDWNATHTTEEVLAAFDRAIEAEEAKA